MRSHHRNKRHRVIIVEGGGRICHVGAGFSLWPERCVCVRNDEPHQVVPQAPWKECGGGGLACMCAYHPHPHVLDVLLQRSLMGPFNIP